MSRASVIGPRALVALLVCVASVAVVPSVSATAQTCAPVAAPATDDQLRAAWASAASRINDLTAGGPSRGFPFGRTGSGSYRYTSAYAWTAGFGATSLWLAYEDTGDPAFLRRARAFTDALLPVARWTGTHDLGFMVGDPARLGARLDPSARRTKYSAAMVTAARSLSTRWNRHVGAIRSGDYAGRWGLIIDSAMNAPLLIEVGESLGGAEGARLQARGTRHMRTLAQHFVRADGSTFHRKAFDPRTGGDLGPIPGQGLSTSSAWARGQAWAIAGFSQAYRLTGDAVLLDAARRTADFWMSRVGAGCVPAWDLDVSDPRAPLDASAAAVATSGLFALAEVDPDSARAAGYRAYAMSALGTLVSPPFLSAAARPGVLQRQSFNVPADRREGSYSFGDAYLLLALSAESSSG